MPPLPKDRRDWLPELALALVSIAKTLAEEHPTPERLAAVGRKFACVVPGHRVEMHWLEHGYMYEPDIDEPGDPEYAITIYGNRLNAGWLILASDLPHVLRLARSD